MLYLCSPVFIAWLLVSSETERYLEFWKDNFLQNLDEEGRRWDLPSTDQGMIPAGCKRP
jgi:hypothetical protein